jgi:glycyl-tRNA synthetase beta chain
VVLDAADRRARIKARARALCAEHKLELIEDEGLLDEVAGLAEWPTPVLGDMDPAFLDLPPEVIRTSMRTHQKYFAVRFPPWTSDQSKEAGALAPHFLAIANIEAADGGRAMAAGYSRVLSARLNDARFFWDEDRRASPLDWLEKLKGVTFHAKLGSMVERVERIAALSRELAPLVGGDSALAAAAGRLSKADLASAMVGEFPELQGVMGGYYARRLDSAALDQLGMHDADIQRDRRFSPPAEPAVERRGAVRNQLDLVADAVRDHYKPQGPSDTVPTAPVTLAVALADKIDLCSASSRWTSARRARATRMRCVAQALGVVRMIMDNSLRLPLRDVFGRRFKNDPPGPAEACRARRDTIPPGPIAAG